MGKIRSHSNFSHPHKHENLTIIPIYMNLHSRLFAKSNFTAINCTRERRNQKSRKSKDQMPKYISHIPFKKKKKPLSLCIHYHRAWRTFAQAKEWWQHKYFRRIIFGWDFLITFQTFIYTVYFFLLASCTHRFYLTVCHSNFTLIYSPLHKNRIL